MGYKCRIAGVMLLLLTSIAALIAVAVIQDTWRFLEYSKEVSISTILQDANINMHAVIKT